MNRLIKESQTGQEDVSNESISYTYDANNNRTSKVQGNYETAYQYNKNNELLRVDTLNRKTEKNEMVIYRYDANGNQVASNPRKAPKGKKPYISLDVTLGSNKANENVVNHYNAKNELIRTLTKDNSVTYEYNADGLRTKKKNHDDVIYYIWDGAQLVLELNEEAKVTKRYLRGNSLITTDNGKEELTTYVTNPHGDIVQLLDKTGKVIKTYDYDAFGNEVNPDEKDENPIRYAGEYIDVETGTQYLRARYYAPELGRFITRDTYTGEDEDSLSLHLYTYCGNEPVGRVDPSGHKQVKVKTLGPETVYRISDKNGYFYTSKMDVCTDGISVNSDKLKNKEKKIIKTDNNHQDGTAMEVMWKQTKKGQIKKRSVPMYCNPFTHNYIVLPIDHGLENVECGDFVAVIDLSAKKSKRKAYYAIFAEKSNSWNSVKSGEASIRLVHKYDKKATGSYTSTNERGRFLYIVFPNTALKYATVVPGTKVYPPKMPNQFTINKKGKKYFKIWGGMKRVNKMYKKFNSKYKK